jgi:hypothetical protein
LSSLDRLGDGLREHVILRAPDAVVMVVSERVAKGAIFAATGNGVERVLSVTGVVDPVSLRTDQLLETGSDPQSWERAVDAIVDRLQVVRDALVAIDRKTDGEVIPHEPDRHAGVCRVLHCQRTVG